MVAVFKCYIFQMELVADIVLLLSLCIKIKKRGAILNFGLRSYPIYLKRIMPS